MGKRDPLQVLSADQLRRMAHILGPSSAAHKALADYEAREAEGREPVCFMDGGRLHDA
jgi:hypothetical protein